MVENVVIMISQDFISYFYFYLGGGEENMKTREGKLFRSYLHFILFFSKLHFF